VEIDNRGGEGQRRGGGSNRRLAGVAHVREMKRGATVKERDAPDQRMTREQTPAAWGVWRSAIVMGKGSGAGRVKQETGKGGARGGDKEGSDNTELYQKDQEGEKDQENARRVRHGAHASTVHERMNGGRRDFCLLS
jgi:hypothetical protein